MARRWLAIAVVVPASALALLAISHSARAQPLRFQSHQSAPAPGKRERVKADLARTIITWRGGNDCRSAPRAKAALKPAVAAWLGRQLMAHPDKKLTGWGYHSGDVWAEHRSIDGRPQCIAGFRKLIVYAEFR